MTKTNKESAKTSAADPRDGHCMVVTFEQRTGGPRRCRSLFHGVASMFAKQRYFSRS